MLGSFEESEDLVQETFLRAWRRRETFEGRSSLRAWLYKIATNACLDALDKRPRTVSATGEVLWLQPYPDELLEELGGEGDDPEAAVVAKETIELAYLVAIQRLVPLQRAVLILRDVLGCSAKETADVLETSVAGRQQRAPARAGGDEPAPARAAHRVALGHRRDGSRAGAARTATSSTARRRTRSRSSGCSARTSASRCRRSPASGRGATRSCRAWIDGGFGSESFGSLRCVVTRANRQPAVAYYVRTPGDDGYSPMALDVLRIVDGAVAEIVTFDGSVFGWFGLPETL